MMWFPEHGWKFINDYWVNQRGSGSVIEKITALAIAIENALPLVGSAGDVDSVDVAVAERSNSESLKCGDKSKSFIVV